MAFIMRKKRFKFRVDLCIEELSNVPFVNGIMFAKVRLLDGGSFSDISSREEVNNHCVKWNCKLAFLAKMTANANTGILEPCVLRISLRKELKGGKSTQKLGFRDLNLAEFAGSGLTNKRFPLEGYDSKQRQDNSVLKITLQMALLSGDPCFKTPSVTQLPIPGEMTDEHLQLERKGDDFSGGSVASGGSSGFGSLPRKNRPSVITSDLVTGGSDIAVENNDKLLPSAKSTTSLPDEFKLTHSRNSSYTSQQSKLSGYSSLHSHSRQGSADSGHVRNASCGSGFSDVSAMGTLPKPPDRKRISAKKQLSDELKENRIDKTRVNADQLIDELIQESNLEKDESAETSGLQLFISMDGSAALGTHELKTKLSKSKYKAVVIDHR